MSILVAALPYDDVLSANELTSHLTRLLRASDPSIGVQELIRLPLVMHFSENKVQELPERRVLRHALVAVDEVVAATERGAQHLWVGTPELRV